MWPLQLLTLRKSLMNIHFFYGAFDGSFWHVNMKELRWRGDVERTALWSIIAWLHTSAGIMRPWILVIHAYHKMSIICPYQLEALLLFVVINSNDSMFIWLIALHVRLKPTKTCFNQAWYVDTSHLITVSKPIWNNEIFLLWLDQRPSGGFAFMPHAGIWHYTVHEKAFMCMHQNMQPSCRICKAFISRHAAGVNTLSCTVTVYS